MPVLLLFIILSSVSFFDLSFLTKEIVVFCQTLSLIIMLVWVTKDKSEQVIIPTFKTGIYFLLVSVALGLLYSIIFWNQSIIESFIVHRELYFYSTYFFLIAAKPNPDKLVNAMLISAVLFSMVFLFQNSLYPVEIVTSKISEERNTIRIYMPGTILLYFGFVFSAYKSFYVKNSKYFMLFTFFAIVLLLRGTRSEMIGNIIAVAVIVLKSMEYQKKNIVYIAAFLVIGMNVFGGVIDEINKINHNTLNNFERDIRIESLSFFMNKFAPNELAYITGNGNASENNDYGQFVKKLKSENGFYQSDIGLVGDYTKFGIFFLIALAVLFYRVYKTPLFESDKFVTYVFLAIFINMFINSEFTIIAGIVPICCMLYLLDAYHYQYYNFNKIDGFVENNI